MVELHLEKHLKLFQADFACKQIPDLAGMDANICRQACCCTKDQHGRFKSHSLCKIDSLRDTSSGSAWHEVWAVAGCNIPSAVAPSARIMANDILVVS